MTIGLLLMACSPGPAPTATPATTVRSSPSPTPYAYPDLPGDIEGNIATGDCESLDLLADFMSRDEVDPVVQHEAMDAIAYRMRELDC